MGSNPLLNYSTIEATFCGEKLVSMDVLNKALNASGDLRVPFIPIVPAWLSVEFVGVIAKLEKRDESANRRQKRFLLACCDV